jgi:hypothetical protein
MARVSGVSHLALGPSPSRQGATGTGPIRPLCATERAFGPTPHDADPAALETAWPTLPGAIRAGILALVKAAAGGGDGR